MKPAPTLIVSGVSALAVGLVSVNTALVGVAPTLTAPKLKVVGASDGLAVGGDMVPLPVRSLARVAALVVTVNCPP